VTISATELHDKGQNAMSDGENGQIPHETLAATRG